MNWTTCVRVWNLSNVLKKADIHVSLTGIEWKYNKIQYLFICCTITMWYFARTVNSLRNNRNTLEINNNAVCYIDGNNYYILYWVTHNAIFKDGCKYFSSLVMINAKCTTYLLFTSQILWSITQGYQFQTEQPEISSTQPAT